MVIFAPQNLVMDPPFTRLDLLSCRNLLIYLETEVQKKLLPLFHYSLNPAAS
jgi:two-component system CheB/CheR fusion protein